MSLLEIGKRAFIKGFLRLTQGKSQGQGDVQEQLTGLSYKLSGKRICFSKVEIRSDKEKNFPRMKVQRH